MKKIISAVCAFAFCAFTTSYVSAEMLANSAKVAKPYVITVPPTAKVTSAFLQLTNAGDKKITVTKVVSSASKSAEIHNHIHADGMMKMVHVPSLDIEPHQTISFEPGSYHVMLIGLHNPVKDGEKVTVTFSFNDGSTLAVNAPVKDIRKMHEPKKEASHDMPHGDMKEMNHDDMPEKERSHGMH